ncbi:MAG TPA: TrmH family RNA methyltransferase [Bacteroidia bacterium]|nr:TrmH family RNA methyltransferase [Bacteroidia bacterium]
MRKIRNDELGRKTVDDFKSALKRPLVLVLDDIRSLNNIGSILRTADAFLCEAVYLCGITACPPHREIHKTALGAEDSVESKYFEDVTVALRELKKNGYVLAAIEQAEGGVSLAQFKPSPAEKYAYVLGHEMNGVSEKALALCDLAIEIPQEGTKHSINVAVCTGIVVWDFVLKSTG